MDNETKEQKDEMKTEGGLTDRADETLLSARDRFEVKPFLDLVQENNEMINWFNSKMMVADSDLDKVRNKWGKQYRDMRSLRDGLYGMFNDMTELLNKNSEMMNDVINAHCR